ncbi:hypothetical protein CEXT_45161 [Caerostris extrusa]|uniref:Uncharacterized protein n=1 Tax=Caerostris extrusa TaxID=172846 RepID=A0AAV4US01_CAEEX|nr:hypothetical protein CEXT_45161 [Caerostris extrusa]
MDGGDYETNIAVILKIRLRFCMPKHWRRCFQVPETKTDQKTIPEACSLRGRLSIKIQSPPYEFAMIVVTRKVLLKIEVCAEKMLSTTR